MLQLLVREQWRGGTNGLMPEAVWPGVPQDEVALVAAAAALGAGEPKRALMNLGELMTDGDGDLAAVNRALRRLALTLEHNWFPGGAGAILEPGVTARMDLPPLQADSIEVGLFIDVVDFFSLLPTLRTFAESSRRGGVLPADMNPVMIAESLLQRLMAVRENFSIGPVALTVGDLYVRSGRFGQAGIPLGLALQAAAAQNDVVGVACCALAQGDWTAEPLSHPELLGEDLEAVPPGPAIAEPDPVFAADRYTEAERRFSAAGATRGIAAICLRRAALHVRSGKFAEARSALDRSNRLATEAGDGALARLALVHHALACIEEGSPVSLNSVAEDVAEWSHSVGSRSFVRGLGRLCHAVARRLRDDIGRARHALLLAEAINDRIGAITEPALVRREFAQQYEFANYWRATLVMNLLDLDEFEQTGVPTPLDWIRLVELALRADGDANALADSEAIQRAHDHLVRIAALEPQGHAETAVVRAQLEAATSASTVMVELYRGVEARAQGDTEEAAEHFHSALTRAVSLGPEGTLTRAIVLGTMRRTSEARALVQEMLASAQLPPDLAAALLVRLKAFDLAEQQLDRYERLALDPPPPSERPWDRYGLRAELLVGSGRAREALPLITEALNRFEEHLAGLSRDVLRTMASDSPVAAGLYTTAVRAHSDLAAVTGNESHVDAGFALSDRSRGVALTDLINLDGDAGKDPATVTAVRAWLRAGAELARTIESVGSGGVWRSHADIRRQIRAAERELDDTETVLGATAPALLSRRHRLPPPRSLAETRERLEPGTLMIQYHAYDDQLLTWAVTRDSARLIRQMSATPILASQVRQCHRAIADRYSTKARREETSIPLSQLLLDPVSDELSAHQRVVFVPHGPLAVLPFHALLFEGSDLATTHEVSYLPTVSAARATGRRKTGSDARTVIVGNPDYGGSDALPSLPGARAEAVEIGRLRRTTPLLGAAATRTKILATLVDADVVHLATHGVLVEGSPYSAELALAQGAGMTVPDLMGLDTSLSLAVLSACDSGRGRATAAGDVIGLTRALLTAGAAELVVSLWPVDDEAACLTMVRLHEELLTGGTPAQALKTAAAAVRELDRAGADRAFRALAGDDKASLKETRTARKIELPHREAPPADLSHPYFWAPFVHIGLKPAQLVLLARL